MGRSVMVLGRLEAVVVECSSSLYISSISLSTSSTSSSSREWHQGQQQRRRPCSEGKLIR